MTKTADNYHSYTQLLNENGKRGLVSEFATYDAKHVPEGIDCVVLFIIIVCLFLSMWENSIKQTDTKVKSFVALSASGRSYSTEHK